MFNREEFFKSYRAAFGSLDQGEVDGLNFLLDKLEQDTFTLKQSAYILATAAHETGVSRNGVSQKFRPIKELRERANSPRRKNQDRYWLTGFYGRGFVQITWADNYRKFGIEDEPDKALEPETAYAILSRGMREGMFTGKKLSDFINGQADYRNARKIINGLDKADEIAGKARKFESILTSSQVKDVDSQSDADKGVTTSDKPADETEGTPPPAPAVEVKASAPSWWSKVTAISMPALPAGVGVGIWSFATGIPPWGWAAIGGIIMIGMILGAWLWNESMKRAAQRTQTVLNAAADPQKNNLRLV